MSRPNELTKPALPAWLKRPEWEDAGFTAGCASHQDAQQAAAAAALGAAPAQQRVAAGRVPQLRTAVVTPPGSRSAPSKRESPAPEELVGYTEQAEK